MTSWSRFFRALCLPIVLLGLLLPAPEVSADSLITLSCGDWDLGAIQPTTREQDFYFDVAGGSPWQIEYGGDDLGDLSIDVAVVMETDFADPGSPADVIDASRHLSVACHDAAAGTSGPYAAVVCDPDHGPLPYPLGTGGSASLVCAGLALSHSQSAPVPIHLRLHLHGDEPPGKYSAVFYAEAEFSQP